MIEFTVGGGNARNWRDPPKKREEEEEQRGL